MKSIQKILSLALLPLWSGWALAAEGPPPGMGDGGMMECGGGMMTLMMGISALFGLLLLAGLILAVLSLIKYLRRG